MVVEGLAGGHLVDVAHQAIGAERDLPGRAFPQQEALPGIQKAPSLLRVLALGFLERDQELTAAALGDPHPLVVVAPVPAEHALGGTEGALQQHTGARVGLAALGIGITRRRGAGHDHGLCRRVNGLRGRSLSAVGGFLDRDPGDQELTAAAPGDPHTLVVVAPVPAEHALGAADGALEQHAGAGVGVAALGIGITRRRGAGHDHGLCRRVIGLCHQASGRREHEREEQQEHRRTK
jgi:hypothetical protein